jgi:hypothetical protein
MTDIYNARTADLLVRLNAARVALGRTPLKAWKASRQELINHVLGFEASAATAVVKAPAKARKAKATKADRRERRRWAETEGLDRKAAKVLRAKLRKAAKAA